VHDKAAFGSIVNQVKAKLAAWDHDEWLSFW